MEIVVTGLGIISAIGRNVSECLDAFENHQTGVAPIQYLQTNHTDIFVAEVKQTNEELAAAAGISASLSRSILLGYTATQEAMQVLPIHFSEHYRIGYFSGTTVGGMDKTEAFFDAYISESNTEDITSIRHHDCGKTTDVIAHELGLNGMTTTISTACSSSANAIMLGARMIKQQQLDIVIAGGVDALTRFTLNGFNTLQILDKEQCRPLDETRAGLNIGEGAAYLVMMNEKIALELKQNILCKITGYHNVNDSFHQTALSEEGNGPFWAMQGALKRSGLQATDITYINLHGTGTRNNDNAEGMAIKKIFNDNYPKLSSTKSFTGHTLGASGAVEAVLSALAIDREIIFPNFSFNTPMLGLDIYPETRFLKNIPVLHVMSNSFGFGGNCSSLIFSKY